MSIKEQIKKIPVIGNWARQLYAKITTNQPKPKPFPGSHEYWEQRYSSGGNSGAGSYEKFAEFKAEIINNFISKHDIKTVIEFGSGDGNQLLLSNYPSYIGFDVSQTVIDLCKAKFSNDTTKTFKRLNKYAGEVSDLSLSLDVIYHLIEDEIFENHMQTLFKAASRYVIIYASDTDENSEYKGTHVKHRKFTKWIQENIPNWQLIEHIPNRYPYNGNYETSSFADFYIFKKHS